MISDAPSAPTGIPNSIVSASAYAGPLADPFGQARRFEMDVVPDVRGDGDAADGGADRLTDILPDELGGRRMA